jgi:hypothetical protein
MQRIDPALADGHELVYVAVGAGDVKKVAEYAQHLDNERIGQGTFALEPPDKPLPS